MSTEFEGALADEILAEIARQRLQHQEVQALSGVKSRVYGYYLIQRSRRIPMHVVMALSSALGVKTSEMLRRAEKRIEQTPGRPPLDPDITEGLSKRQIRKIEEAREAFDASDGHSEGRANEPPRNGSATG